MQTELPPVAKLLTPQQTSKMFELMNHNQLDVNDLASGYQSLSLFQEKQNLQLENRPKRDGSPEIDEDRDVVFLGAESSGGIGDLKDD